MTINEALRKAIDESWCDTEIDPFSPEDFRRALAASGYAVVPVEATEEMLEVMHWRAGGAAL